MSAVVTMIGMSAVRSEDLRAAVRQELGDDETVLDVVPAIGPRRRESDSLGMGVLLVVPLLYAVERLRRRRASRRAAADSRFPWAPRMVVALTERRLLVWRADRDWHLGDFVGDVTRDRIVRADAPTVGVGWRTVRIFLAEEPTVSLRVPSANADDFAEALCP